MFASPASVDACLTVAKQYTRDRAPTPVIRTYTLYATGLPDSTETFFDTPQGVLSGCVVGFSYACRDSDTVQGSNASGISTNWFKASLYGFDVALLPSNKFRMFNSIGSNQDVMLTMNVIDNTQLVNTFAYTAASSNTAGVWLCNPKPVV